MKHYPETKNKVVTIPNGVEEDVMNYKWQGQQSNYMIYAGRIEKYKRLELALQTAEKLGTKLLIIGQGPYRKKLEKYVRNHYRDLAELLEPQPREKYLELVSKARYAINPSKHEAYSIFIAEALAIGTPAIITKEIAENLNAETQQLNEQLVIATKAPIKTWTETMQLYLKELYQES
jgi:glycosyltransferase involved in cell wall biosynthesis